MALACKPEELIISTHTLTWSVTYQDSVNVTENSISTHTLTWSVTQELSISVAIGANFNSHAHVERDLVQMGASVDFYISTHTLTWSVTSPQITCAGQKKISTHTLTWSVTNFLLSHILSIRISTHTLTWSVTKIRWWRFNLSAFQLTRSRGA